MPAPTGTTATPSVTVTPSLSSIGTTQDLSVTVSVSGTPTPTGSVTLTGGGYTSSATTLVSGVAIIDVPAGSLATGTDSLMATYTPDSNSSSIYTSATGTASVTVVNCRPRNHNWPATGRHIDLGFNHLHLERRDGRNQLLPVGRHHSRRL